MKSTDYYNYKKNISVVTTPNGDKVVTMNNEVFVLLMNHLSDAAKLQKNEGHNATSEDTKELWEALMDKEKEGM
jgi:Mn-dependent DtxR family transcriptional regulator